MKISGAVWAGIILVGIGIIGRAALMQSDSYSLGMSAVFDLVTVVGIVCLIAAFFMHRKRKKQDKQLQQVRDELARNPNREPRQGVPRRRD